MEMVHRKCDIANTILSQWLIMYVYMCSYVRSKKTQCYTERVPCNSLDTAVHEGRIPVSHPWAELLITQFCFNESAIRFAPPLFHVHIHVL